MSQLGEAAAAARADPGESSAKQLRARFNKTTARCGDDVTLMAQAVDIPDGTAINFELKNTASGGTVAALSKPLQAAQVRLPWVTKKWNADWSDRHLKLKASGGGETAAGENQLEVGEYKDIAVTMRAMSCASGKFKWTGKHDIELVKHVVLLTIKIKLLNRKGSKPLPGKPLPPIDKPVSEAHKAIIAADIEGKLGDKNYFHRARCRRLDKCVCPRSWGCCKLSVRLRVLFVENGAHHEVNLFQGSGRANATNWTRKKTRANSWAHETGHLLGWYDEYPTGAVGAQPRWKSNRPSGVMNVGLEIPTEYYEGFRDWLAGKTAEPWKVVKV